VLRDVHEAEAWPDGVAGWPGRRSGMDPSDVHEAEAWPDGRDAGAEWTRLMDMKRRRGRMAGTPERNGPG
jgi:hypothetical protein